MQIIKKHTTMPMLDLLYLVTDYIFQKLRLSAFF